MLGIPARTGKGLEDYLTLHGIALKKKKILIMCHTIWQSKSAYGLSNIHHYMPACAGLIAYQSPKPT